ncbi:hypothetical protein MVEN_01174900 [Mycena venus]|uniref:Uncharacterized protein n=1 Tax=Mycena venus TaxID=2733690 RepID=A0A8H7CVK3_9AGAR|nr:hypothetical protein MVEN_01174900 [Mycena venus]
MYAPMSSNTSRSQSWMALSAEVSLLPSIKAGSASLRKRFRSVSTSTPPQSFVEPRPTTTSPTSPRIPPQCPRKSALKRPTTERRASLPTTVSSTVTRTEFPIWSSPAADEKHVDDTLHDRGSPPSSPISKVFPSALLGRVRNIHIFTPSPSPPPSRRASRIFEDLPPPPDLDEVSVTVESDEEMVSSPTTPRKVRFVVPAPPPPPPTPEPEYEEPAWCDFM